MKQRTRILIIDDKEGMRRSLEVVLEDEGYSPLSACSAVEASDYIIGESKSMASIYKIMNKVRESSFDIRPKM